MCEVAWMLKEILTQLKPPDGATCALYISSISGHSAELVPRLYGVEAVPPRRGRRQAGQGQDAELHRRRLLRHGAGRRLRARTDQNGQFSYL